MKFTVLCLAAVLCVTLRAQSQEPDPIVLFMDEPLPAGAKLISSKNIHVLGFQDYYLFNKSVLKNLNKVKGNLARIEDYKFPTPDHGHRGTVSFYTVPDLTKAWQFVQTRRDSLENIYLQNDSSAVTLYFFRFKLPNKLRIDWMINGKVQPRMEQNSTYTMTQKDMRRVTVSGKVLFANDFSILPRKRTYFIECTIVGGSMTPMAMFSTVPDPMGRYMFNTIQKAEAAKKK